MAASPAPVVCSTAPGALRLAPRPWPARRRRLQACNACELLQAALRARAAELFSRIVGVRVGSYRSRASRHRSLTPETACRSGSPRSPPLLPRALSPPSACRRFEARRALPTVFARRARAGGSHTPRAASPIRTMQAGPFVSRTPECPMPMATPDPEPPGSLPYLTSPHDTLLLAFERPCRRPLCCAALRCLSHAAPALARQSRRRAARV